MQVGKLTKQLAENSNGNFGGNTKPNPKEQCKAMVTRNMKTKCPINEEMVKGVVEDASDDEKVEGENENEGEKNKEKKMSLENEEK